MVENAVVKEMLSDRMIEAGERITRKLDESGVPISVAMWLFLSDMNEWRLFFVSPELGASGPRELYTKIEQARTALGDQAADLPLSAIGLLQTGHPLVQTLRKALRTGPGVSRIRFSKNVIDGHFIEDALIYRNAT